MKSNAKVTGAARLYRAASVWTAGLDHNLLLTSGIFNSERGSFWNSLNVDGKRAGLDVSLPHAQEIVSFKDLDLDSTGLA